MPFIFLIFYLMRLEFCIKRLISIIVVIRCRCIFLFIKLITERIHIIFRFLSSVFPRKIIIAHKFNIMLLLFLNNFLKLIYWNRKLLLHKFEEI
jgi:hypothetical protein